MGEQRDRQKFADILGLPTEVRQRLDTELVRDTSCTQLAAGLQRDGFFPQRNQEHLARQLRRYKLTHIDVPQAARQIALRENPKAVREVERRVDGLRVLHEWHELLTAQQARTRRFIEQQGALPTSAVQQEVRLLNQVFKDFMERAMDAGLIYRAPQKHQVLTANMVQVHSEADAGQLIAALMSWASASDEPLHPHSLSVLQELLRRLEARATAQRLRLLADIPELGTQSEHERRWHERQAQYRAGEFEQQVARILPSLRADPESGPDPESDVEDQPMSITYVVDREEE